MAIDRAGSTTWIASLVISARMPSIGLTRKFAPNAAATPANAAARPASGWRPRLKNADAPSGISTR